MLVELRRVFTQDLVPALTQGELRGGEVDSVLVARLKAEVLPTPDIGKSPGSRTALATGAATELSTMLNLTNGARPLIARSATLEEAVTYLFADKAFKEYLRNELREPRQLSQLNRLISAVPMLVEPERFVATQRSGSLAAVPFSSDAVLDQLRGLDTQALRTFLSRAHETVVLDRVVSLFREREWDELGKFAELFVSASSARRRVLTQVGRANIYNGNLPAALQVLSAAYDLFTDDPEIVSYRGTVHARMGDFAAAAVDLRRALELQPKSVRIKRELGNVLRMGSKRAPTETERRDTAAEAVVLLTETLEEDYSAAAARTLGRFLHDIGQFERCVAVVDRVVGDDPDDVEALVLKSRAFVSLNRVSEALAISTRVLELDPGNQTASFMLRAMRFLADGVGESKALQFGDVLHGPEGVVATAPLGSDDWQAAPVEAQGSLLRQLREAPFDWIRLSDAANGKPSTPVDVAALQDRIGATAGCHVEDAADGSVLRLWRREAVIGLVDSGLIGADLSGLDVFERFYVGQAAPAAPGASAVVASRHGSFKFGGGEHFIESMAEHYSTVGFDPIVVGTRQDFRGQSGKGSNGFRFDFVEDTPAALRRLFLTEDVRLVHAISGLGFAVAEALSFTNIPFIYGVHFWREALGTDTDDWYFDSDGAPMARPEFNYVLSRATTVYANSEFTRDVLERAFGVRCPVVFSVPKEGQAA